MSTPRTELPTVALQPEHTGGRHLADAEDTHSLVMRATAIRRDGGDAREDVRALLRRAAQQNQAALDRLAR